MPWHSTLEPSAPLDSIVGHVHVPKCAGTSFRLMLQEIYGDAHLRLYFEPGTERILPTTYVYSDAEVEGLLNSDSVKAFSSHFVRRFPATAGERKIHYVTFLRDPLQQFISYLGYARQVYRDIADPVLISHLPPNMPERSLHDCARWLMQQGTETFLNFRENYTTNFFARYEAQSKYGLAYSDRRYRAIRLRIAKSILQRFFFVGISEWMEESWWMLRRRLADAGVEIPAESVRRENISDKRNEDLSWLNRHDKVGCAVLRSLRDDQRLYRWARRRFLSQLRENRKSISLRWWERVRILG